MKNSSKIIIGIFVVACVIGIISSFFGNAHNINKMATLVGTSTKINIAAIAGVTAPVTGVAPVTNIAATTEYTAIISWSPTSNPFAASTVYKATITITPKVGYTLSGVGANFFTVAGATATNSANSGIVTAMFPATAAVKVATKTTTVYVPKSIVLKLGEKNVMVAVLQRTLVKDGFFNYPITGVFDKNTLIAVEALQKANKLPILSSHLMHQI